LKDCNDPTSPMTTLVPAIIVDFDEHPVSAPSRKIAAPASAKVFFKVAPVSSSL
jgi:hypothetical protein